MSTNQTQHLHLSQWEENDEILRADFNADNSKIDAALAAVKATADTAFSPAQLPWVIGTYTGNSSKTTSNSNLRTVSLGFKPTFLFIYSPEMDAADSSSPEYSAYYTGAAIPGVSTATTNYTSLKITDTGFQVGSPLQGYSYTWSPRLNDSGRTYFYLALK